MNEDLAALFHGTYARLVLKARRLIPCVLCALRPRVNLVTDDKVERVVELVVSCVVVPVFPLKHLHDQGRHHRRHHRRRRHHYRDEPWEGEEDGEGEENGTALDPLPPLMAPPPPLLPPGLSAYLQALSLQHTTHRRPRDVSGGSPKAAGASGGSPAGALEMPPQQSQSPSVLLPLSPLVGIPPMPQLQPAPPAPTTPAASSSASSSLIGRVASLTKSGRQTLLRRGQRALQLAATPLFSSSSSRPGQQPPAGGAVLSSPGVAPAVTSALGVGSMGLPDPRSLVELTPLSSVPGARVVRYLGAWGLWMDVGCYNDRRTDGVTWALHRSLPFFLPSIDRPTKQAPSRCTL